MFTPIIMGFFLGRGGSRSEVKQIQQSMLMFTPIITRFFFEGGGTITAIIIMGFYSFSFFLTRGILNRGVSQVFSMAASVFWNWLPPPNELDRFGISSACGARGGGVG